MRLPWSNDWVRFDRGEFSGSLGDVGTDLPLLLAMIAAAGLDGGSVFIVFGLLQIVTGLVYGLPMPMQPLKAMAVIVITGDISASVLAGGGISIGLVMLVLALAGALGWLVRMIPKAVVRGVQVGLGLKLARLSIGDYAAGDGAAGWAVAAACFAAVLALRGNKRLPPAVPVLAAGLAWAVAKGIDGAAFSSAPGIHHPILQPVTMADLWTGFLLLALPQLPLSLSNSVIATHQTINDLFPGRRVTVRKIGISYAMANLFAPWLGGIPVCHGCGGLAGHHAMGGRTGGSTVIYGSLYLGAGLLLGDAAGLVVSVFPRPVLGAVLLVESLALMMLSRDMAGERRDFLLMLIVAVLALAAPQGFLVGMLAGLALHAADKRLRFLGR